MQLTTEVVKHYEGGQLRLYDFMLDEMYRAEIKRALVEQGHLKLALKWVARLGDDGQWYVFESRGHTVDLHFTSFKRVSNNRIRYRAPNHEVGMLFLPGDGSKLDPRNVIGLQIAEANKKEG